ncbi:hypothetical protein [Halobellus inordinatus]|uniref:hypothetical protein n=1 Tax=Halobellus inordinatus TaxID=1126236 RepID=UPI002115418C|nr:hypothetical protein [Halobellus ramosii]
MSNAVQQLREARNQLQAVADQVDDENLSEELRYADALVERVENNLEDLSPEA